MKSIILASMLSLPFFTILANDAPDFVQVSGECQKKLEPDRVRLFFTIDYTDKNQSKSSSKANQIYTQLKSEVNNQSLKDLELNTNQYTVQPVYNWIKGKKNFEGYQTLITLQVTTSDLKKSGSLFQIANKLGNTQIQGPNPFVSAKKYKENYRECLKVASQDALEKANVLAKSLGAKVGKPLSIVDSVQTPGQPRPMHYKMMMSDSARVATHEQAPDIEFAKQDIKMNITVSFELH
ncbi:MAG: SIMPL domain-containing protein [Halobacteriovoraceae bacterium]|nr:SIMPL domain-containing protein [Halobacteriovoraceae bacterium]